MKILMVTTREDRSRDRITEEARKRDLDIEQLFYEDMDREGLEKREFRGYDFCILRDPYNTGKDYSMIMKSLIPFFDDRVLDSGVFKENPEYEDKLFQHKLFGDIMEMPEFRYFNRNEDVEVEEFPVIIKKRISSRGRDIFIINNREELERFINERDIKDYLFEKRMDVKKDIRILIIGNEIIGALERRIRIKDNQGYNGIGVKGIGDFEVPDELREKFIEISRRSGSDFCGLDFIINGKGENTLIEVNISPQFVALERVLDMNIAGKLIDFIIQKKA
jgi:hypothetical protein